LTRKRRVIATRARRSVRVLGPASVTRPRVAGL
jgi:hypothetical protein